MPMPQIQLSDELFQAVQKRALQRGYPEVEEYVAVLLRAESELTRSDDFFTPERLKQIDEAVVEADAGLLLTIEQVEQQLTEHRQAWLDK
jgi:hypothetical protein